MAKKGSVKEVDMGWIARFKQLGLLTTSRVEVGLPDGPGSQLAAAPAEDGGGVEALAGMGGTPPPASTMTLATLGYIHEYGTRTIPARPWLTQGLAASDPSALMRRAAKEVLDGKRTAAQALERAGMAATAAVQKTITAGLEPALKPATIARKGSSKPLVDSGRLRGAITYKVIMRDTKDQS